jgi:hypothetical protein
MGLRENEMNYNEESQFPEMEDPFSNPEGGHHH